VKVIFVDSYCLFAEIDSKPELQLAFHLMKDFINFAAYLMKFIQLLSPKYESALIYL